MLRGCSTPLTQGELDALVLKKIKHFCCSRTHTPATPHNIWTSLNGKRQKHSISLALVRESLARLQTQGKIYKQEVFVLKQP
jgi:hypothetical protein